VLQQIKAIVVEAMVGLSNCGGAALKVSSISTCMVSKYLLADGYVDNQSETQAHSACRQEIEETMTAVKTRRHVEHAPSSDTLGLAFVAT
jgi:hypothetical protein